MIKIIDKYITKSFLKAFSFLIIAGVSIYFIFDFFEKIDNFINASVPQKFIFAYFLFSLPKVITQVLPTACLLGALISLTFLKKHNELTAMQASGISPYGISASYFMIGLLICLGFFLFNEIIVPKAQTKANNIWLVQVRKKTPKGGYFQERIWLKGEKNIYQINAINLKTKTMFGITIYFFTPQFQLEQRLDARQAIWDEKNKVWIFYDGVEQKLIPYQETKSFQKKVFRLKETLEDFQFLEADYQRLNIWQLKKYITQISSQGYDPTVYTVDFWQRTAIPLTPLILIVFAISLVFKGKETKVSFVFSLGLIISFIFWVIQALSIALGKGGYLNPFLAAWLPNILFGIWGIIMLRYLNE